MLNRKTDDKLALPNAQILMRYGANKLWQFDFIKNGKTTVQFAATHGRQLIAHVDYLLLVGTPNALRVLYDAPERFPKKFRNKVTNYFLRRLHHAN